MLYATLFFVGGLTGYFWPDLRRSAFWVLHWSRLPLFNKFYWSEVDQILAEDYDRRVEDEKHGL